MKLKAILSLTALLATVPALAADRVYSFPQIQFIRGFDTTNHPQTIVMTGGPSPRAVIPIGPVLQGTSVRVRGTVVSTSGILSFAAASVVEFQVPSNGAFDETFVLDADADSITIVGGSYETATISALYVDVL